LNRTDVQLLALLLMAHGWEHDLAHADARVLLWFYSSKVGK
jgi:hypothetical protein